MNMSTGLFYFGFDGKTKIIWLQQVVDGALRFFAVSRSEL